MNDCASVCIIENNEKDSKIPFSCCKQKTHEKMKKKGGDHQSAEKHGSWSPGKVACP